MRKLILIGTICAAGITLWAVWRFGYDGVDPRLWLWPRPPESRESAALDAVVSLDVKDRRLHDVLAELSQRHEVRIGIDQAALSNVGASAATPVTLKLRDGRLHTALRLLARQVEPDPDDPVLLIVDRDGEPWLTERSHWFGTLGNYTAKLYPLDGLLSRKESINEDDVSRAIRRVTTWESWPEAGGNGELATTPGGLQISQTAAMHRRIERFLDALASDRLEPAGMLNFDPPSAGDAQRDRIQQALQQGVTLDVYNARIDETVMHLAAQQGLAITFDHASLKSNNVDLGRKVTQKVEDISLEDALALVLEPFELRAFLEDEALVVSFGEWREWPMRLRLYETADLCTGAEISPERMRELAMWAADPTSWDDVGGRAAVTALGTTLVVLQTEENHRDIERVLTDLRDTRGLPHPPGLTPRHKTARYARIEGLLATPISFEVTNKPLSHAVARLRQEFGLPIACDPQGLAEADVSPDQLVSVFARDVPLATVLDWMLEPLKLTHTISHETLLITEGGGWCALLSSGIRCHSIIRLYQAGLATRGSFNAGWGKEGSLVDLLGIYISPDDWGDVGGWGTMEQFGDVLIVDHFPEKQRQMAAMLATLERRLDTPNSLAPIDIDSANSLPRRRVLAALEQPSELEFYQTPLRLALRHIAETHGVQVHVDEESLAGFGVSLDDALTVTCGDVPLESALERIAETLSSKITFHVRNGFLELSERGEAYLGELPLRLYPVYDLQVASRARRDELVGFLIDLLDNELWDEFGGAYAIDQFGDMLMIAASPRMHQRVEQLLAGLRRANSDRQLSNLALEPLPDDHGAPAALLQLYRVGDLLQQTPDSASQGFPQQLRDELSGFLKEDPRAGIALWGEVLGVAGPQSLQRDVQQRLAALRAGARTKDVKTKGDWESSR